MRWSQRWHAHIQMHLYTTHTIHIKSNNFKYIRAQIKVGRLKSVAPALLRNAWINSNLWLYIHIYTHIHTRMCLISLFAHIFSLSFSSFNFFLYWVFSSLSFHCHISLIIFDYHPLRHACPTSAAITYEHMYACVYVGVCVLVRLSYSHI